MNKRAVIEIAELLSEFGISDDARTVSKHVVRYFERNGWSTTKQDITQTEYNLRCYLSRIENAWDL